ncbi:MAG: hypothetical protein HDT42_04545 [Ruminococcaceae bacterium]|nr:hypothetical protein [Oscillospiraceae bacterium]
MDNACRAYGAERCNLLPYVGGIRAEVTAFNARHRASLWQSPRGIVSRLLGQQHKHPVCAKLRTFLRILRCAQNTQKLRPKFYHH